MNQSQLLALRINNRFLRENVDASVLLAPLVYEKVIEQSTANEVKAVENKRDKARKLFDEILIKHSFGGFYAILSALRRTRQGVIADHVEATFALGLPQIPKYRLRKGRRIVISLTLTENAEAHTDDVCERAAEFVWQQLSSTDNKSFREYLLEKYALLIEYTEKNVLTLCIAVLPTVPEKMQMFFDAIENKDFQSTVQSWLKQAEGFQKFNKVCDLNVKVRKMVEEENEQDGSEDDEADFTAPATYTYGLESFQSTETTPSSESNGSENKNKIFYNVIKKYIETSTYNAKDLFQFLQLYLKKRRFNIERLTSESGLNLLHEVVICDRVDLIKVFYDLGLLRNMQRLAVHKAQSKYNYMTPPALAEAETRKCKDEMEAYILKDKKLTKMCTYARVGNLPKMKELHEKNANALKEISDGDGSSPVYWAVVLGSEEMLEWLFSKQCDFSIVVLDGDTILTKACGIGNSHLIKPLIEKYKVDFNKKGAGDKLPIERVAEISDFNALELFLSCGAELSKTVLHAAAKTGQAKFIEKLLSTYGKDLNVNELDKGRRTPLMLAAESNHVEAVQVLLRLGAKIDMFDIRGRNVLHYAADITPSVNVAKLIIDEAKKIDCLESLLNAKELYLGSEQCFLVRGRDKGHFAYHYVVADRGLLRIFKNVINRGHVDVGKYGKILLSGWGLAPPKENVDKVASRYDPKNIVDNPQPDMTPLHYAVVRQSEELAILFIENGANVNIQDIFGMTAYHLAAMRGLKPVIVSLEDHGIKPRMLDNKKRTAVEIAEQNQFDDLANYLRSDAYLVLVKEFVNKIMPATSRALHEDSLKKLKADGKDVREHIIYHMRELEASVTDVLFNVGSSPVMQPSENS